MKTKTIKSLLAVAVVAVTLNSCDAISRVDLKDQKSVDKMLPSKIEKHIDPQSTVFEIMLGTTSDFSTEMDVATVEFLSPGATEPQSFSITIPGNQKPREGKIINVGINKKEFKPETGIKLSDVDFSKIASNVAKATEMLKVVSRPVDGISSYTIKMDGKPENTVHSFNVRSKENTELGSQHGRAALVTNYYEFSFTADAEGNVTSKDL